MPSWIMTVLFFAVVGVIYLVVSYIGNKIVDKGGDAIENTLKRKKNAANEEKTENLQNVFVIDYAQTSIIGNQKYLNKRRNVL